ILTRLSSSSTVTAPSPLQSPTHVADIGAGVAVTSAKGSASVLPNAMLANENASTDDKHTPAATREAAAMMASYVPPLGSGSNADPGIVQPELPFESSWSRPLHRRWRAGLIRDRWSLFGLKANASRPEAQRGCLKTSGTPNTDNRSPTKESHEFKAPVGVRCSVLGVPIRF